MTTDEQRDEIIRYWWSKAQESLVAAEREFNAKAYEFAVNRLYYAAFYAVSAALLKRNLTFRRHSGVRSAFHREFVKPGLLEKEWGRFYDQLITDRQEADYVALIEFDRDYVEFQLDRCAEFLHRLRASMDTTVDD
jgi:uncharacterized protein (UPF0332 family)